jgi:hypothetical protein
MGLSEFLQDLQPVQSRHFDVEKDQAEPMIPDQRLGAVSVVGDAEVVSFATQAPREHVAVHLVVDEHRGLTLRHGGAFRDPRLAAPDHARQGWGTRSIPGWQAQWDE